MKKVLIASFDMEIGGVEKSLIGMLNNFNYKENQVDLMLYSHTGDLLEFLPHPPHLLKEVQAYRTFRKSIGQILKTGKFPIALTRFIAKCRANLGDSAENGYKQMQYMWKYALPFLPRLEKKYDIAISYLWPHYFVAEKVEATTKVAWIHTDYSMVDTNVHLDVKMWGKFDYLVAVSNECKNAFIKKYPEFAKKTIVIENMMSPSFIRKQANMKKDNPLKYDRRFKIITVARLSYAKGIDHAVKALKLLKDRGYNEIAWYVVGYGGDEAMVRELIHTYELQDHFILLGKKINPYPFMKEADIYVQPSRYEGKAVTVVEAQILGKPVLITNYPTAKSQVKEGLDGVICDLSVEGIADGIERLYNNLDSRIELANNCRSISFRNDNELEKLYLLI